MCLVISLVFIGLSYIFYQDENLNAVYINGGIALFFVGLLIRNILKTKKERES